MATFLLLNLNGGEGNLEACFTICKRGMWTGLRKLEKGKRKIKGWLYGQDAEVMVWLALRVFRFAFVLFFLSLGFRRFLVVMW